MMAQILGPFPAAWETAIQFLAQSFVLAHSQTIATLWEVSQLIRVLLMFLSPTPHPHTLVFSMTSVSQMHKHI